MSTIRATPTTPAIKGQAGITRRSLVSLAITIEGATNLDGRIVFGVSTADPPAQISDMDGAFVQRFTDMDTLAVKKVDGDLVVSATQVAFNVGLYDEGAHFYVCYWAANATPSGSTPPDAVAGPFVVRPSL